MNIELIVVGKTDSKEVEALVEMYAKRVNRYCRFSITTLADVRNTRNMAPSRQKQLEGEAILRMVGDGDCLTLMDERGGQYTSIEFSQWLQKRMLSGVKRLVLVIPQASGWAARHLCATQTTVCEEYLLQTRNSTPHAKVTG